MFTFYFFTAYLPNIIAANTIPAVILRDKYKASPVEQTFPTSFKSAFTERFLLKPKEYSLSLRFKLLGLFPAGGLGLSCGGGRVAGPLSDAYEGVDDRGHIWL
jgi:hypothetical protein